MRIDTFKEMGELEDLSVISYPSFSLVFESKA